MNTATLTVENLRSEITRSKNGEWSLFDAAIHAAAVAGSEGRVMDNVFETTLADTDEFVTAAKRAETALTEAELAAALDAVTDAARTWLAFS